MRWVLILSIGDNPADGTIEVFDNFQTKDPSIYAVSDVTGSVTLTPVALAEGIRSANV